MKSFTPKNAQSGSKLQKAWAGLIWGGGFQVFHQVLQFLLTLVLARLLSPADFGSYAVVAGIIGFLNAFSCQNFLAYLVQTRDNEDPHLQDHFTAAVIVQSIIFVATNLVAWLLSWLPSYAELAGYIYVMSPIILLSSVGSFRNKVLERNLDWPRYRTLQAIGVFITLSSVLALSLIGFGVYALLASQSFKYLPPLVDLFLFERFRPTWTFHWNNYRPAFWFGVNRLGSEGVLKGRTMTESNLLLFFTNLTTVGFFNRAVSLSNLINGQLATVAVSSIYPVLTRIEPRTPQYRRACSAILRGVAWVVLPMSIFCAVFARDVITILFGAKWLASVDMVPLMMLVGAINAIGHVVYSLLLSINQQRLCFIYDSIRFIFLIAIFACWALYAEIAGYLTLLAVFELLATAMLMYRTIQLRVLHTADIARSVFPPLAAGTLSAIAAFATRSWISNSLPNIMSLLLVLALFVACYLGVLRFLFSKALLECVEFVPFAARVRWILGFVRSPQCKAAE